MNMAVVVDLERTDLDLKLILIESGGIKSEKRGSQLLGGLEHEYLFV